MNYRSRVWRVISAYSACAYVDRPSQEVKMFANRRSETNYFSSTCNTRRYKKCAWILISLNLKLKSNFTPLSFDVCKKCSGNLAKMTVSFATRSILIFDDFFWSKYKRKYKGIPLNYDLMTCWLAKTQYHFDGFMK